MVCWGERQSGRGSHTHTDTHTHTHTHTLALALALTHTHFDIHRITCLDTQARTHTNSCLELHSQGDELTDSTATHAAFKER